MKISPLEIPDIVAIQHEVFEDERGYFYESFNLKKFQKLLNNNYTFVQDNHSKSSKGVLRGLHFQIKPFEQGKLISVIKGEIFDVAVDIRKKSPTFGKWVSQILSENNKIKLWIPPGFAHGFLSLKNNSQVVYKTTEFYNPSSERSILWNDPDLKIKWPKLKKVTLSEKDSKASFLKELY
jgi:dTDP-4-dehydrorhamnose 3,5-epimerase